MEFVETSIFARIVDDLLDEESQRLLQLELAANPEKGSLIRGTGGLRKLRWAVGGRGKRGGARLIYYWTVSKDTLLMLYAYPKNVQDDLTPAQRKALAQVVKDTYERRTF